ncbi:MAG: amino acid permease [Ectothiorhodospiraceae bacterium]|nr:amino acid permease [Chromatiales bacterium]MCP5153764.1 amino acid permease [Ectothiorhodospiraceae bacterium]
MSSEPPAAASAPVLRRSLGLWMVTLYGLGNILGAGIYVLVGEVAGASGYLAPLAFLVSALVAAPTALSYGELAARYPRSAGEAVYLQQAFGRRWLSFAVGCLVATAGMVSTATLARGFASYLTVFVEVPDWLAALVPVVGLSVLAAIGIGVAAGLAAALTFVEVAGLLVVIGGGVHGLADLPGLVAASPTPPGVDVAAALGAGAFLAFYAFLGFEDMVNVAEEVRRPERDLPLGIVLAMVAATVLYLLVVAVCVAAVPPAELAQAQAPLALVHARATGSSPLWLGALGLVAVLNGALVQTIMASRVAYGMACEGWLPSWLARVHPRTATPVAATAAVGAVVAVLAVGLPLGELARATSAIVLVVFALIDAALIRVHRTVPAPPGVRRLPTWVPWVGLVVSVGLLSHLAV